jgi:pimeloyl-ACP methyl ester carboxylesterase
VTHRRILAVSLVCTLAVGCGGNEPKGRRIAPAPRSTPEISGVPGRLVQIGSGRSLFVDCVGSGSPTIVLEAGLGANGFSWHDVQPQLGRTTRTCAYDRAGIGSSVALPGVHDARDEIDDLQRLLDGAHVDPPYVIVGHSYGGLLARLFAQAHANEVAGMVLVDSMGRNQTRRQLAIWPKSQARAIRRRQAMRVRDGVDLATGEALAARITSLGDTPLVVVTAGRYTAELERMPAQLSRALFGTWQTMQDELAALSSDHVHVVALRSDHFVQEVGRQPDVVIRAVRAVVRTVRDGTRLPPCRRLFSGRDVRCRG